MRRLAARSTSCRCISQTANASPLITYLDSTPPVPAKKEMDISTRPISSRTVRQKLKHSRQAIALSQPLRSLQFSSSSSGWKPVPARAPNTILNTGGCIPTDINSDFGFGDYYAWYTSNANAESESSGSTATTTSTPDLSTGEIVGIIIGSITDLLLVLAAVVSFKRRVNRKYDHLGPSTLPSDDAASLQLAMNGQTALWSDDVITAKRISRDRVTIKKLISRGAYGEVYVGRFYRQVVAVKMLLPSTRSSIHHVNQFLAEAKMTASMDHPHIVTLSEFHGIRSRICASCSSSWTAATYELYSTNIRPPLERQQLRSMSAMGSRTCTL